MASLAGIFAFVVGVLLVGGFAAPLIRRATPALVSRPRAAVAILTATIAVWLLALAAIGPMVAWVISGPPVWMPGSTAEFCQRCLAAANPFPEGAFVDVAIPALLLVMLPLLLATVLLVSLGRLVLRKRRSLRAVCRSLRATTVTTRVQGYDVVVVNDPAPLAFALPRKCRGVVISQSLLNLLNAEELRAVLAHETAHLRQRHHLLLLVLEGLARPLRWVPLIRTVSDAVPHYLEIAADDAARRETGTPALASALLKLGDGKSATDSLTGLKAQGLALHAAGVDRIRRLVAPSSHKGGTGYVLAVAVTIALMTTASTAVHGNYVQAVLAGCVL